MLSASHRSVVAEAVVVKSEIATSPAETSSEIYFRPFDMHGYRRSFPDRWAAFLKTNFRDAGHIAFMFSVTERTAQNWLHCTNAPRPECVLAAIEKIPAAAMLVQQ